MPEWIIVSEVKNKDKQAEIEKLVDKGEASSIALALETKNSTLVYESVLYDPEPHLPEVFTGKQEQKQGTGND